MRNLSALFSIVLLTFAFNASGENSVTLPNVESVPGPVIVEVDYDFTAHDVYAFEIAIEFDTDELEYVGYSEGDIPDDVDFQINESSSGLIDISWSKTASRDDAGVLVNLEFDYSGTSDSTPLTFETTAGTIGDTAPDSDPSWLSDTDGNIVTTTFTNGSIIFVSPVPLSIWALLLGGILIVSFVITRHYRLF